MDSILHGWWSPSQYVLGGSSLYLTPDGREVEVTQVTPGVEHESGWHDMEYLGPVNKCVRQGGLAIDFLYDEDL